MTTRRPPIDYDRYRERAAELRRQEHDRLLATLGQALRRLLRGGRPARARAAAGVPRPAAC